MERSEGRTTDNYENVNMDMSDGSDNEMFACKEEYKAFKTQFSGKSKKEEEMNEYGGGAAEEPAKGGGQGLEYGGTGVEMTSGGSSEYGPAPSLPNPGFDRHARGQGSQMQYGGYGRPQFKQKSPSPTPAKIEKQPKLYRDEADKGREKRRSGSRGKESRRSKSKERSRKTRSKSKERRRSHSRDRGGRKRSRSRSRDKRDRRDDHHRDRRDHDSRDRREGRRDWDRDGGDWRRDRGRGRGRGGWDRRGGGGARREEQRRQVEEQMRKVEEMGVEMPKYYKAGAVNPISYAEQMQKRKLLWKKAAAPPGEEEPAKQEVEKVSHKVEAPTGPGPKTSFNKWEATNFGDDSANEKFRRLMGIKAAPKPEELADVVDAPGKNSDKLMTDLQRNYDVARQQTHRNRGIGLGFSEGPFASTPAAAPPAYGPTATPTTAQPFHAGGAAASLPRPHQHQKPAEDSDQSRPAPVSFGRGGYGIKFVKKQ